VKRLMSQPALAPPDIVLVHALANEPRPGAGARLPTSKQHCCACANKRAAPPSPVKLGSLIPLRAGNKMSLEAAVPPRGLGAMESGYRPLDAPGTYVLQE
jgi:hypothetical protein